MNNIFAGETVYLERRPHSSASKWNVIMLSSSTSLKIKSNFHPQLCKRSNTVESRAVRLLFIFPALRSDSLIKWLQYFLIQEKSFAYLNTVTEFGAWSTVCVINTIMKLTSNQDLSCIIIQKSGGFLTALVCFSSLFALLLSVGVIEDELLRWLKFNKSCASCNFNIYQQTKDEMVWFLYKVV